jgi:hypothetical protein
MHFKWKATGCKLMNPTVWFTVFGGCKENVSWLMKTLTQTFLFLLKQEIIAVVFEKWMHFPTKDGPN